jgi:hypothetical protein
LTELADIPRKAGLKVEEVPGWRTRGHGEMLAVRTIVCHHTAGPASGEAPSLGVVRDGRPGLEGPLSHYVLGRSGAVYVVAAGLCWHTGNTFSANQSNPYAIGIEAEATGTSNWPDMQYQAYAQLCRALMDHYGLPLSQVLGHKEVAAPLGRKIDPNFSMNDFRIAVSQAGGPDLQADERTWLYNLYLAMFYGGKDTPGQKSLLARVDEARSKQAAVDPAVVAQSLIAAGIGQQVASELIRQLGN